MELVMSTESLQSESLQSESLQSESLQQTVRMKVRNRRSATDHKQKNNCKLLNTYIFL